MPRNVTGALMGDPGHGPSPSAYAFEPQPRPWHALPTIHDGVTLKYVAGVKGSAVKKRRKA